MPDQTPAQTAYEAYGAATGGLTHDGRPMPAWDQLGDRIQHAWAAAALALGIDPDVPRPAYGDAWAELTGYVQQAVTDGGTIDPVAMAAYMRALKRRALTPVRDWVKRTAEGKADRSATPTLTVTEYTVNALPAAARVADWWVWDVRARHTRAGHWVVTDGHSFYDAAGRRHFTARDAGAHLRADALDLATRVARALVINGETAGQAAARILGDVR